MFSRDKGECLSLMTSTLLSVDNVTKLYSVGGWLSRAQIAAVASVSLRISAKEPEILTLVGESGMGRLLWAG